MNICQVSGGQGGSLSFEVIEEVPKEKDIRQTGKTPTANMTKDYYLYYVKSTGKSIKLAKTPADR